MNIKETCKYTYECIRTSIYALFHSRINPRTHFLILSIIVMRCLVLEILFSFLTDSGKIDIRILILGMLSLADIYLIYFRRPQKEYQAAGELEMQYVFEDERIIVTGERKDYKVNIELSYSMVVKAMETSKYLLVFRTKRQCYVVDKSTITNGTIDDIRGKLIPLLKTKYKKCRY